MTQTQGEQLGFGMDVPVVESTEQKIRAQQVALGDTVEGRRKIFETRTIRQITLAYDLDDAREMATWLKELMKLTGTKNPSDAMLAYKRKHYAVAK